MRLIVGISGASGVELGYRLVKALKEAGCEVHLVLTRGAEETWRLECPVPLDALEALADARHEPDNLGAVISSGSFETGGMIVLPCSMKSLSAIAHGYASDLLTRAADVCLKEGRKVVLCPREMPLGKVHLKNMLEAADLGCVIIPPLLTFYNLSPDGPRLLEAQIDHLIGKIMSQFCLRHPAFVAWDGSDAARRDRDGRP